MILRTNENYPKAQQNRKRRQNIREQKSDDKLRVITEIALDLDGCYRSFKGLGSVRPPLFFASPAKPLCRVRV